jgi:hypothetical protein
MSQFAHRTLPFPVFTNVQQFLGGNSLRQAITIVNVSGSLLLLGDHDISVDGQAFMSVQPQSAEMITRTDFKNLVGIELWGFDAGFNINCIVTEVYLLPQGM